MKYKQKPLYSISNIIMRKNLKSIIFICTNYLVPFKIYRLKYPKY